MTSAIGLGRWLPVYLLILLAGNPAGQAAGPKKPADKKKPADNTELKLPALLSAKPLKVDRKDDELRTLLKARYNEAVSEAREYYAFEKLASESGISVLYDQDRFYKMWHRVVGSGLELCDKPAEKVALLTQYLAVTKEVEKLNQEEHAAGRIRSESLHRARFERLDAGVRLLRAKREGGKAKDK